MADKWISNDFTVSEVRCCSELLNMHVPLVPQPQQRRHSFWTAKGLAYFITKRDMNEGNIYINSAEMGVIEGICQKTDYNLLSLI